MKGLTKERRTPDDLSLTETPHEALQQSGSRSDDFYHWAVSQVEALQERRHLALDWEGLAEELEAMAHRDERELIIHLRVLLLHLLKWTYALARRAERNWANSIVGSRQELSLIFDSSTTLSNKFSRVSWYRI
jgi:hypothetical protein